MSLQESPEILEKSGVSCDGAARGAALVTENRHLDPELALVAEQWPCLPRQTKTAILALIGARQDRTP
jgi:hypothetical protein